VITDSDVTSFPKLSTTLNVADSPSNKVVSLADKVIDVTVGDAGKKSGVSSEPHDIIPTIRNNAKYFKIEIFFMIISLKFWVNKLKFSR